MNNSSCVAAQSRATMRPGAEHTFEYAVATPTESGVFSRPKFGNTALCRVHSLGLGVVNRKATSTAYSVCSNPVPPNDLNSQRAGFKSQYGAKTMATATTTTTGKSAQTTPTEAALRAILAEVTFGVRPFSGDSYLPPHLIEQAREALAIHERQSMESHQHAHNALSCASWHIARNELPQAMSRLRRANSHIAAAMEGGAL